jgi:hypothetical protein
VIAGAVAVVGCGSSASSLCSELCDCEGCSEAEQEDCVDEIEDSEKRAADAGCEQQFDELVDCLDDQLECRDGGIDADGCEPEAEDLAECSDFEVTGPAGSVCDRAVDICGAVEEPQEFECTGAVQCVSQCIVAANSCDIQQDSALAQCLSDCQQ